MLTHAFSVRSSYLPHVILCEFGHRIPGSAWKEFGMAPRAGLISGRVSPFGYLISTVGLQGSKPKMPPPWVCHAFNHVDPFRTIIPRTGADITRVTHELPRLRNITASSDPCHYVGTVDTAAQFNLPISVARRTSSPQPVRRFVSDPQATRFKALSFIRRKLNLHRQNLILKVPRPRQFAAVLGLPVPTIVPRRVIKRRPT